jgi:hypothetical protein
MAVLQVYFNGLETPIVAGLMASKSYLGKETNECRRSSSVICLGVSLWSFEQSLQEQYKILKKSRNTLVCHKNMKIEAIF